MLNFILKRVFHFRDTQTSLHVCLNKTLKFAHMFNCYSLLTKTSVCIFLLIQTFHQFTHFRVVTAVNKLELISVELAHKLVIKMRIWKSSWDVG